MNGDKSNDYNCAPNKIEAYHGGDTSKMKVAAALQMTAKVTLNNGQKKTVKMKVKVKK